MPPAPRPAWPLELRRLSTAPHGLRGINPWRRAFAKGSSTFLAMLPVSLAALGPQASRKAAMSVGLTEPSEEAARFPRNARKPLKSCAYLVNVAEAVDPFLPPSQLRIQPSDRVELQHLARRDGDHLRNHPAPRSGSQLMTPGRLADAFSHKRQIFCASLRSVCLRAPQITASIRPVKGAIPVGASPLGISMN